MAEYLPSLEISGNELDPTSASASATATALAPENPIRSSSPIILDYSYSDLRTSELDEALSNQPPKTVSSVETILSTNINLLSVPDSVGNLYRKLKNLDLSSNQLTTVPETLVQCELLSTLVLRNNLLTDHSFPKDLSRLSHLRELNLSGNQLTKLPEPIFQMSSSLITLHLGANRLTTLQREIGAFRKLQILYLGGNQLVELPPEVGLLTQLKVFVLCENRLESLPNTVSNLKQLKSLLLHQNRLTALPVALIKLRNLMELSLRDNPLVVRFVRDLMYNPPSLMELAARNIKMKKVQYDPNELPKNLASYLKSAHECVYFDTCVEHIKFVDFCGKYRIPLLQYLCSPKCSDHQCPAHEATSASSDSDDNATEDDRIRKVLLG